MSESNGVVPSTPITHHLIKAFMSWFEENNFKEIPIHVRADELQIPYQWQSEYKMDVVKLNLHPLAVIDLVITEDGISFKAKRNGEVGEVYFPLTAVLFIELPLSEHAALAYDLANLAWVGSKPQPIEETPIPGQFNQMMFEHYSTPSVAATPLSVEEVRKQTEKAKADKVPHLHSVN